MLDRLVQSWTTGWRGLALAAVVALVAALPGLALPVTDREEARTAQATAQMLESGDFVAINFQNEAREGRAIGVYWPQAASVAVLSSAEARVIWPYRLPSLIGAMLLAIGCAWGASAFWGQHTGVLAGAGLGVTLLASIVGALATADAVAAGLTALALAALARIYAADQAAYRASDELDAPDAPRPGRRTRIIFWLSLAGATLAGGWAPPAIAALTALGLFAADRRAPWLKTLGWTWGMIAMAAMIGPWLVAITVSTDGEFWAGGVSRTLIGTLDQTAAAVALSFPMVALAPGAILLAWKDHRAPGVRFALAWLGPALLMAELGPGSDFADALLVFPPLAWLAAAAWMSDMAAWPRRLGGLMALAGGVALIAGLGYFLQRFADGGETAGAVATIALLALASVTLAYAVWRHRRRALLIGALLLIAGQGVLIGGVAPGLDGLWPSKTVVAALRKAGLDPAGGLVKSPVAVAGYEEPSLVFALGAKTEVGDGEDAADAIVEGRPAIVEAGVEADFRAALAEDGVRARPIATVRGLDYAANKPVRLTIWRRVL